MRRLVGTLAAELLKLRRSPALLVAIVAPYLVVLFAFLILLLRGESILAGGRVSAWSWLLEVTASTVGHWSVSR